MAFLCSGVGLRHLVPREGGDELDCIRCDLRSRGLCDCCCVVHHFTVLVDYFMVSDREKSLSVWVAARADPRILKKIVVYGPFAAHRFLEHGDG